MSVDPMDYLCIEQVVKDFGAADGGPAFRAVDQVSLRLSLIHI